MVRRRIRCERLRRQHRRRQEHRPAPPGTCGRWRPLAHVRERDVGASGDPAPCGQRAGRCVRDRGGTCDGAPLEILDTHWHGPGLRLGPIVALSQVLRGLVTTATRCDAPQIGLASETSMADISDVAETVVCHGQVELRAGRHSLRARTLLFEAIAGLLALTFHEVIHIETHPSACGVAVHVRARVVAAAAQLGREAPLVRRFRFRGRFGQRGALLVLRLRPEKHRRRLLPEVVLVIDEIASVRLRGLAEPIRARLQPIPTHRRRGDLALETRLRLAQLDEGALRAEVGA
mmetsp:Transcript_4063/g.11760  ORF Transcript_4063/g.11760 Transcript_4063/m.11760 type:complete len:290 (-) Transcript_4063:98-967(-)